MRKLPHLVLCITLALGLGMAGASYSCPSWPSDLGLDFWNVSTLRDDLTQHQRRHAELDRQDALVLQRIAAKEQIVQAVIAGRIGLLDAAAQFAVLNATPPKLMADLRAFYPSGSDEECLCRNVIEYVENRVGSPAEAHLVLQRLRAELEQFLATGTPLPNRP